jgi:hypothetical protein
MKKISIITAMAAMVFGFASCSQEDEPQYHNPTTFTVCVPGLQDQEFTCSDDLTDNATFNLFCSQPDYGYSAICSYSALVSLDPTCPVDDDTKTVAVEATNSSSAAMAIKTYELGVAVTKLAGYTSQEEFDADPNAAGPYQVYMRAVCEIPSIEGSRIVSSNVVSYNNVKIKFAQKSPAWIYVCGYVNTLDNSVANDFLSPGTANLDTYMQYWRLFEPDDMIGEKIYVGQFNLSPRSENPDVTNPDDCASFRFFTDLAGWTTDYSMGSNEADFYTENITDKSQAGYTGDIVWQGLGNWGIAVGTPTPITIVVDQTNLKIYIKEGLYNVTFLGRDPSFE